MKAWKRTSRIKLSTCRSLCRWADPHEQLRELLELLKRGINGTYVSVEPFHLFRYVDEQAFRCNNRLPMSDKDRFSYLVRKSWANG